MTLGSHNRKNGGIARLLITSKTSTTTLEKEVLVTEAKSRLCKIGIKVQI